MIQLDSKLKSSLHNSHYYAYETFDPAIDKFIAFQPVQLATDLERIHRWMNQPHVIPFWNLALDIDRMRQHLQKALADSHQTLYLGLLDSIPMSYWEAYWVADDVVSQAYDFHPEDQGIHLLIGEPDFLGKGYALPLLRAMTAFLLQHPTTEKVIAEPDIRNRKMIHVFERCGFEFQREINLPDKQAALMFCHRENFLTRWNHA